MMITLDKHIKCTKFEKGDSYHIDRSLEHRIAYTNICWFAYTN